MSETLSSFQLSSGDDAPDFALSDAKGQIFEKNQISGLRGLLVVFSCNHCPYVVHLADSLGGLAGAMKQQGIHTVAINSNDVSRYPEDGPEPMLAFSEAHQWQFPYLLDTEQTVAKAYGAVCTPDFFLIDEHGKVFYTGQYDDSRPRNNQIPHGGDLTEAVRRMLNGEGPLPRPFPSSGCNIKWKS